MATHAQPGEVERGIFRAQGTPVIKEPEPAGCRTILPRVPPSPSFEIFCERDTQEEHNSVLC